MSKELSDEEKSDLVKTLEGKTVTHAVFEDDGIHLTFDEDIHLCAKRCAAAGNGEFDVWTNISIDGKDLVDR